MCKVEEYNAVYKTTTENKVYITKMRILEEKMKQDYVTLCIRMCMTLKWGIRGICSNLGLDLS